MSQIAKNDNNMDDIVTFFLTYQEPANILGMTDLGFPFELVWGRLLLDSKISRFPSGGPLNGIFRFSDSQITRRVQGVLFFFGK